VLVPVGALAGLPAEQMEALLLHELAHIRRYDYLINALQNTVEALLFYHPAVWWISGHMRQEREMCCDDIVVAITGDTQSYARALAEIGAAEHAHYHAAVASTGGSLSNRVARLLGEPRQGERTHSPAAVAASVALVAITTMAAFGQTARPQFEVASIKPAAENAGAMMRAQPGRLIANASLHVLIQNAFGLQPFQIIGGPEWIAAEQFNVDAKAAGNPGDAQMFLMLRSLLEDRFELRSHQDSREMTVYTLMAARGGPKLSSPRNGSCVAETDVVGPLAEPAAPMAPPTQGVDTLSKCGGVDVTLGPGGARIRGSKVPMAEFVRVLSRVLRRPVSDQTGFTGQFDVAADFLPDDTTPGLPPPPPGAIPFGNASPSIFSAVQEMGLRLESTRRPVNVLVVDHVERPVAN
jgi:uncharacterized protein (TIGR03435 family)